MLIYILSNELINSVQVIENFSIIFLSDIVHYKLSHTDFLSKKKFGIRLTTVEIELYNKHYSAWMDFVKKEDEMCLILETYLELIQNRNNLPKAYNNSPKAEIILPFNPTDKEVDFTDITYSFGCRIGSNAYYINKKAALKLIKNQIIALPVDEMFVHLSSKNLLDFNILENNHWIYNRNHNFFLDRNENKLSTILSTNLWTRRSLKKAVNIIKYLFNLAEELKLSIFLSDGTLLGFVRHGCIMGWDDDVDLSLDRRHLTSLISKIEQDNKYNITKHYWANKTVIYYKVWDKRNKMVSGYPYSFPFVDIWIYDNNEEQIDFSYFPSLPYKIIYPLATASFCGVKVCIPNQPLRYLDKMYSNWRTSIQIFKWRHQTETASNLPLQAMIETDSNGQILLK